MNFNLKLVLSSLVVLLTACGGSGSGSTNKTISSKNTSPVAISINNVDDVSLAAVNSVFNNFALSTTDVLTGIVIDQADAQFNINEIDWVLKHLEKSITKVDNFTGVVTSETFLCLDGGSVVQTLDWQDEFTVTVNDYEQYQYNDCYAFQVTTNGLLTITYTQVSDFINIDDFSVLGLNISFDNYSLQFDGSSVAPVIVGEYTLLINRNAFTQEVDITAETLAISIPGYQQTIENLVIEKIYTENTNVETLNVSSTLIDSFLGGSVTLVTLENFEFDSQESLTPFSGSMKITGENNSSIVLTVINSTLVQLESDFNGDNTIDNLKIVTWDDLDL